MQLKYFSASGKKASQAEALLVVPQGYKIVSGGAFVTGTTSGGNMLTASYPGSIRSWFARSSDQQIADPAVVNIGVLAVHDPNDEYDVQIGYQPSAMFQARPVAGVWPLEGYVVTGGGACANYSDVGAQQFLTVSGPTSDGKGWTAASRDHLSPGRGSVTAYYVGMRRRDGRPLNVQVRSEVTPVPANMPHEDVGALNGFQLIGGGASVEQRGDGNLLTASAPRQVNDNTFEWFARSQDQRNAAPTNLTVYGLMLPL